MSEDKLKASAKAIFTQYMSQHKLRRTPERFAILERVMDTHTHFSINALHTSLDSNGYHVSRATIYNTILLLIDAGLVRRNAFNNGTPRYEKISGLTKHYHLVCTKCGKIKEVKDPEIDILLNTRRYSKFYPLYADLYIHGVCSQCMRKNKSLKNNIIQNTHSNEN